MREVAQGYVEIVATATAYIYNIEVKQYDKEDSPALLSFTASGTTYFADERTWTEAPVGTFSTTIFVNSKPASAPTAVAYVGTLNIASYTDGVATITVTKDETTKTYKVTFSDANTITVVASAGGTVSPSGEQAVVNGGSLEMTATPNAGYYFVNWTNSADDEVATTATWTATNVNGDETYTAHFAALYSVTYGKGSYTIGSQNKYMYSNVIAYADKDGKFTMPNNYAIVYNATNASEYTLTAWTDGENNYTPGSEYTLTGNLTLTPVFTANAATLTDSQAQTVVTWAFAADPLVHVENATGYFVQQATINGNSVDIPMYIYNTSASTGYSNNGKFASSAGQVQARRTKLTIPAITGMKVVVNAKTGATYIFRNFIKLGDNYPDGSTASDAAANSATYTYSDANGTVDICIYDADIYIKSIAVTYPVTASEISISTLSGRNYASYVTPTKLNFADAGIANDITAYIATGLNGTNDAVVLSPVNVVPANTPIIVKTATQGTTVNVPVTTADADAVFSGDNNKLVAGDGTTEWNGTANTTYYYLASDQFHQATSGTLQNGKAYLAISTTAARDLNIVFNEDETTALKLVKSEERTVNSEYYNLAGQRVAQPTKGLYIINGKKVIVK